MYIYVYNVGLHWRTAVGSVCVCVCILYVYVQCRFTLDYLVTCVCVRICAYVYI